MITGLFFHPLFKDPKWPVISDKFKRIPEVFGDLLDDPRVRYIEPTPAPLSILEGIHTERLIRELDQAWYRDGALMSIGAGIQAAEMVWDGELNNAVVFGVAAGHHAERDSAWGGTYASVSGPIVRALHERGVQRVAIVDTDSHHGNGTRDVTMGDREVLHLCFCDNDIIEDGGTKVCVDVGWQTTDDRYLQAVRTALEEFLIPFQPQIILHLLGHDTARTDYGNRGLSLNFFPRLVTRMKKTAKDVCGGKYIVGSHGGARRDVCERVFTDAIKILINP